MVSVARIVDALGGRGVIREPTPTYDVVISKVRAGLPYAALEAFAERFEISRADVLRLLHLPLRTLARRKKERRLHPAESDRLLRLGRIAACAEEVLGERQKAARWLQKPNRTLGGAIPLSLLDTDAGAQRVEEILGRIAHGIYS